MKYFAYLRIRIFQKYLKPFQESRRKLRMAHFVKMMKIRPGLRVLDLGGTQEIWSYVNIPLDITLLNLPGQNVSITENSIHTFRAVEGNGCDVKMFKQDQFELVFSNSVIEHVGAEGRRKAFADEVIRLGKSYWIQTPSKSFPIEAHTGMPYWWYYPQWLRQKIICGWQKKLPKWTEMIVGTDVLSEPELVELFPGAELFFERAYGFKKSCICCFVQEKHD